MVPSVSAVSVKSPDIYDTTALCFESSTEGTALVKIIQTVDDVGLFGTKAALDKMLMVKRGDKTM